ncbi:MAG: GNAT family N-acetyltransferase [Candidatus Vogelbacteria bacterium]|nr:GNAT family N-acetyltransferase [Candidatus Vogelbacteria bacterium]
MAELLSTGRILLRPICEKDYQQLHIWRNEPRFLKLVSPKREVVDYQSFVLELKREFERGRHQQFMLELNSNRLVIGTVYSFNLNLIDGYVFVNAYTDEGYECSGYGAEAVIGLLCYLFGCWPIHKICCEVFEYNDLSLSCLKNAGFVEEGRFREHRFWDGKRYDVIRLALYRTNLGKCRSLLQRFQERGKQ